MWGFRYLLCIPPLIVWPREEVWRHIRWQGTCCIAGGVHINLQAKRGVTCYVKHTGTFAASNKHAESHGPLPKEQTLVSTGAVCSQYSAMALVLTRSTMSASFVSKPASLICTTYRCTHSNRSSNITSTVASWQQLLLLKSARGRDSVPAQRRFSHSFGRSAAQARAASACRSQQRRLQPCCSAA